MVSRAAQAMQPTLQTNKSARRSHLLSNQGLTLIEIMITIAIIAFVVAIALTRMGNNNNDIGYCWNKLNNIRFKSNRNALALIL
jgi:prepilin-type N-terminal cleavage/methylation domain-containing protein